jgi:hypothetical protein
MSELTQFSVGLGAGVLKVPSGNWRSHGDFNKDLGCENLGQGIRVSRAIL